VRGSDLQEGDSQGLPVWSRHVGDPILKTNLTRRVDFALFMVDGVPTGPNHDRGRRPTAGRQPQTTTQQA
jgi:hypothetical protein